MTKKPRKFALDIFALLGKLNDAKSDDAYLSLTETERKGFSPLVTMRWMSGTSDQRQLMCLNEFVNPAVFSLAGHPHLLSLLLQVASSKTQKRYPWLGIKSKKKNALARQAVSEYLEMSSREVNLLNPFPPSTEILRMAEELGWQQDEIKKLEKELSDEPIR